MTFLNFALLGGIFAFNIPIIIHLFNRSKFKVVPWGAMHLLEPIIRKNMRRIKLEQLILLLIRAAIPVLLALVMMRPVLTGWQTLAGSAKSSMVVLLDTSYSMQAAAATQSNFELAQDETAAILRSLPRGSEVSLLQDGGVVLPLTDRPTFDLGRLETRLMGIGAGAGRIDTLQSFDHAIEAIGQMQANAKRDIVLVSDFHAINWEHLDEGQLEALHQRIASLNPRPNLTLFHVGQPITDNIAVTSVTQSSFVVGVGQPVRLRAELRNFGQVRRTDLRVQLFVDGVAREERRINLDPGQSDQVLFQHVFQEAGSHWVEVRCDADAIKADNSYLTAVNVLERLPVLLVAGQKGQRFGEGDADSLEIALQPFSAEGARELTDLIEPRVIEPAALVDQDLSAFRVIILANVPSMPEAALSRVEQFVEQGGGLLIYAGHRVTGEAQAWYDRNLYRDGLGLLPTRLQGERSVANEREQVVTFAQQSFDHPALALFNDPRNGNLADIEFRRWMGLREPRNTSERHTRPFVIARLQNGDPFMVEKNHGDGRVIVIASSADNAWGNFASMGYLFVPLSQRLVTYMASQVDPPRNVEVGQSLTAFLDARHAGKRLEVTFYPVAMANHATAAQDPVRRTVPVDARGPRAVASFSRTHRPGLYVMHGEDIEPMHFVVNTSRVESDIRQLPEPELDRIAQALDAKVVRHAEEFLSIDRERRYGREIWKPIFWAMLALLLAEMLFQQFMTRRRSA